MPARIITIANQKGGCGKTTVTMTLAGALARQRHRVLVVDADRQGSALTWSANAPEDKPFPARVMNLAMAGKGLGAEVRKFLDDADVILIDCPPAVDSPLPLQALVISDVVLVPLLPSPTDFAAAQTFFELINTALGLNPSLQVRVVPNMVQKTALTTSYMAAVGNLPFPRTLAEIGHRVSYKEAAALGCTVDELPGSAGAAKAEVRRLTAEVLPLLGLEATAADAVAGAPSASVPAAAKTAAAAAQEPAGKEPGGTKAAARKPAGKKAAGKKAAAKKAAAKKPAAKKPAAKVRSSQTPAS